MRRRPRPVTCAFIVVALLGGLTPIAAQNPIQAARDAFRKAQEEARKKKETPPAQPATPAAPTPAPTPTQAASTAAGANAATPGVLSAADFAKLIASAGSADIVGIKLGMTPAEALAAIKAANPKLTVDILRVELQIGSRSVPTPNWAYAHGPQRGSTTFNLDGSGELIGLQFSLPPNPPVVISIIRAVQFANAAPVARSTLLEAFRTKYGPENVPAPPRSERMGWVFDDTGKQVKGPLPFDRNPGGCSMFDPSDRFPFTFASPGQDTGAPRNWTIVNELSTRFNNNPYYRAETPCAAVASVISEKGVGAGDPKDVVAAFMVELRSPALEYHSIAATNAFLRKAIEDEIKKEEDAGAKRAAPKL